jgi:hypothetical protein
VDIAVSKALFLLFGEAASRNILPRQFKGSNAQLSFCKAFQQAEARHLALVFEVVGSKTAGLSFLFKIGVVRKGCKLFGYSLLFHQSN